MNHLIRYIVGIVYKRRPASVRLPLMALAKQGMVSWAIHAAAPDHTSTHLIVISPAAADAHYAEQPKGVVAALGNGSDDSTLH